MMLILWIGMGCSAGNSTTHNSTEFDKGTSLTIFAASSLTDVLTEMGASFNQQNSEIDVDFIFNFAGSNQLATQLGQGAPADIFASANSVQMMRAIEGGRVHSGTQRQFAQNRLTVVVPMDNPRNLRALDDLRKSGAKVVVATAEVPIGQYTLEFLDMAAADSAFGSDYRSAVLENIVSYETNVRSVLSKVRLGEADAGVVYRSDVANDATDLLTLDIPNELSPIGHYVIAPLSDSSKAEIAQQFMDYVLGKEGQQILRRNGFDAEWQ